MPHLSGKQAFVELLINEGVTTIFGNPGTTELPVMDALAATQGSIRYVLGLQEATVIAMADGYAQASRTLTAVNVHITPGLGNAMGMLAGAFKSGAPMLVTAGQQDQHYLLTEPSLGSDLVSMARPVVKWAHEVRNLAELPRAVHRAAKLALTPPTGPVFLSLPTDVMLDEGEVHLGERTRIATGWRADPSALAAAADILAVARRPVIIAGDGIAQSNSHAEIIRLAEMLGAPVFTELPGSTSNFPSSHPLFAATLPRTAREIRQLLDPYDVLFSACGDLFTLFLPSSGEAVPDHLKIVHLDNDDWQLGKNYVTSVAILSEPRSALSDLCQALHVKMSEEQRLNARRRNDVIAQDNAQKTQAIRAAAREQASRNPVGSMAVLSALADVLPANAVIVNESISSAAGLERLLKLDDPSCFFGLRASGIGFGIPAAIGIKLAMPDRPVVALVGDGSALYTCQALWTAAHERIAVTIILINNKSYRILKQRTNLLLGNKRSAEDFLAMDLIDPEIDYLSLAKAFGVRAERVGNLEQFRAALGAAISATETMLIEIQVDGAL